MVGVIESEEFVEWVEALSDGKIAAAVKRRIKRAGFGNFGHAERLTSRVSEMKIHLGKGYRIYYSVVGEHIAFLLAGGGKKSQGRDIRKAEAILDRMLEERRGG